MRGCWRLCCRTRGRGRATAEDGMCSRVEADDSEASPKLSGGAGGAKRDGYDRDDIRVRESGIQKDSSHGDIYVYVDIYIYMYIYEQMW